MKKILIIVLLKIVIFYSYSVTYDNPQWDENYSKVVKIDGQKFAPEKLSIDFNILFDAVKGIYIGGFYELKGELTFAQYLIFEAKLRLGENIPKFKTFDIGTSFYPLTFFRFYLDYMYRDYSKYKIGEHNIMLNAEWIVNTSKYYKLSIFTGANLRFVDLNIDDYKTEYKTDWLFDSFLLWQIKIMVHPVFFYSVGLSIGDMDEFEVFSFNYWEFNLINYFHLPKGISIFADGGFAYAGSLPLAGIINRFWVRTGFRYEIKFNH
jgi:hypothetical protein